LIFNLFVGIGEVFESLLPDFIGLFDLRARCLLLLSGRFLLGFLINPG